jgi:hypothetical protein
MQRYRGAILGGNLLRLFQQVHDAADGATTSYPRFEIGASTGGATPL